MRSCLRWLCAVLSVFMVFSFASCKGKKDSSDKNSGYPSELDWSDVDPAEHVSAVTYKGLTVSLEGEELSKEDALWKAILQSARITGYPEDKVAYYIEQTKDYYKYLADGDRKLYDELIEEAGLSDEGIRRLAEEYVKKDLVYLYIVSVENIELTAEEKSAHFDKYVGRYVEIYGYGEEYVNQNMADLIYDSMLYDKTMEFLLINNQFN